MFDLKIKLNGRNTLKLSTYHSCSVLQIESTTHAYIA